MDATEDLTAAEYRGIAQRLLYAAVEQRVERNDLAADRQVASAAVWAQLATSAAISESRVPRGDCYRCKATDVPVRAELIGDARLTHCAGGCRR